MKLIEYNDKSEEFFKILPRDWQENIVPYWNHYAHQTKIYVYLEEEKLIGGGLVFDQLSPDMEIHRDKFAGFLKKKMKYLGFIWIIESHRSLGLGKKWLQDIIALYPETGLWLSIEEESLKFFYQKMGFNVVEKLTSSNDQEWIMVKQ